MSWEYEKKALREQPQKGRPKVNPFLSQKAEEDFVVHGRKVIEKYYKPEPPTANPFQLSEKNEISKTLFWGLVYVHLLHQKVINPSPQAFMLAVEKYFGHDVACDRSTLSKRVGPLIAHGIDEDVPKWNATEADKKNFRRYNPLYRLVAVTWDEILYKYEDY